MRIDAVAKINLETQMLDISYGSKILTVGGENGLEPGELFCSGLVSCTAAVAYNYCMNHDLPLPLEFDTSFLIDEQTGNVATVELNIKVPAEFPENRLVALEKAVSTCDVKQAWLHPPEFLTAITRSNTT
jgi:uncharacterized OsmC-like protein